MAYGVRPGRDRLVLFSTRAEARQYAERVAEELRQAVAVERLEAVKELQWLGGRMWLDGEPLNKRNYLRAYRTEFEAATPSIAFIVPCKGIKKTRL